jgi:hypothetical protein
MTVTQIQALRTEAGEAGDFDQVRICDAALAGDPEAIAECERVINYKRAQAES